ncbi:glucose 1-dehydrogenase [Actinoplanes utahensis]|uniref:Theronine dehydrogenase n=1 Tax=Actinoplanes utahensis TaxID=1869 RepID=A0A0A6UP76_ACTUT|nr:glucose 1-dehydrogenase [Actinoplanes utahensis]KHD76848.1 theronine dehydrogenase [Actinoplanes utahensis]GIF33448.1 threonine dehydrogenase [Actinoplanes utahensis]
MRALTVVPGVPGSLALRDIADPAAGDGDILVETLAVGLCATDADIVDAELGEAPSGSRRLVIGHESLGRVLSSGDSRLRPGDLVVGIVRHPDPVPCPACAAGEWDMCRNGGYTSRGITRLHGFARERWRSTAEALIPVAPRLGRAGVLVEPASVVAKAWEQIERIGGRASFHPGVVVITGAGPVGLLAAMMATQRGYRAHVFDLVTEGPKPDLVRALGARYHTDPGDLPADADIMIECTGSAEVIAGLLDRGGPGAITCLLGMSPGRAVLPVDVAALNRRLVRQNGVVFGSVNANRRHYEAATASLTRADPGWLDRMMTRRVALADYAEAFRRRPGDVKTLIEVAH